MQEESNPNTKQHFVMAVVAAAALVYVGRLGADHLVESFVPLPPAVATSAAPTPVSSEQTEEALAAKARQERARREQALIEEDRLRREAKRAAALAAFDESARAAREEQDRKEEAWRRYYRAPRKCDNPPDQAAIVECGNQFMRAQRRFEQLYAEGKLGAKP